MGAVSRAVLTSRVVQTARGPIEVADAGTPSGPVLLVLHGMPGDYRQGRSVVDDVGDTARVLLVSRPGYGRSPLSSGRSPSAMADLYAALLDALGVDRAVVLGISGGGPSAYSFAVQHPSRCAGLLQCCAVAAHVIEAPVVMRRMAAVPGLWSVLATVARGVARVRPPQVPSDDEATPAERALLDAPGVRDALAEFTRDTPTWLSGRGLRNDTRQLRAVTAPQPWPAGAVVPTVVLHGSADELVTLANAEAYVALVPGAQLEVLDGIGHAVPLFARAHLAERLRELLASSAPVPPTPGRA